MRIITDEYRAELLKNKVYQMIINTKTDRTQLHRDAAEFEEWIAEVHKRERAERMAQRPNAFIMGSDPIVRTP